MEKPFWEDNYRREGPGDTFEGGKPSAEVREIIKSLPAGAEVLDLGCGDGRHSIFLAEKGFNVTAVDISEAGIGKLLGCAEEKGLSIKTVVQDIREYEFPLKYDLVIAHGVLHLIAREDWTVMIHKIKEHTNENGYNIIAVFTDTIPPPDNLKEFCVGLFKEGELYEFYDDWNIILKESYILADDHPGDEPHEHALNKLVARKIK